MAILVLLATATGTKIIASHTLLRSYGIGVSRLVCILLIRKLTLLRLSLFDFNSLLGLLCLLRLLLRLLLDTSTLLGDGLSGLFRSSLLSGSHGLTLFLSRLTTYRDLSTHQDGYGLAVHGIHHTLKEVIGL